MTTEYAERTATEKYVGRAVDRLDGRAKTTGEARYAAEHRITIARSHAGAVRFDVGRAEDLGAFEDSSFDAVCLSSVLHWVADKARALDEIRRVLRPGGRVAMTTVPQELSRAGTVARVLQPLLQRPPYADHVGRSPERRGCTSTELVSLVLTRSGERPASISPARFTEDGDLLR